jgi:hypothetical protein
MINKFTLELLTDFCNEDHSINWEKLVMFNSADKRPKFKAVK